MAIMAKQDGAFLTIGELAKKLGVPHHKLRYWEEQFPTLRPLQRAGRRRYYRPQDVALATYIYQLLHVERYTIEGARQVIAEQSSIDVIDATPASAAGARDYSVQNGELPDDDISVSSAASPPERETDLSRVETSPQNLLRRLGSIRKKLAMLRNLD